MDESVEQPQNLRPKRVAAVIRARNVSATAWRATSQIKTRASEAKLAAHRRVEPFWPATIISAFVTAGFYAWTLQMIGVEYAWTVAFMAIGSNIIQEIGHWQTMTRMGYPAHFLFLPWLVILLPKDPTEYASASRWHKSLVALFGPAINSLLIALGLLLMGVINQRQLLFALDAACYLLVKQKDSFLHLLAYNLFQLTKWGLLYLPDWSIAGKLLVSVNAGIATMSLLPIPFLDGGKLLKNLLESVGVAHDRAIAAIISGVVLSIAGILFLLGHFHPYPVAAILGTGWLLKRHQQEAHLESLAMTTRQAWLIFIGWLSLFSYSLSIFLIVPATIKPENTQRALEILSNLWRSLS